MRLIRFLFGCLTLASLTSFGMAAPAPTTVRAIAFVASHEAGATDARLANYESVLRANLRFESFRYVGESSAVVSPGGHSTLAVPGGGQIQLEADANGHVQARRGGTVVSLEPGHPAVFMSGAPSKGSAPGVIVML